MTRQHPKHTIPRPLFVREQLFVDALLAGGTQAAAARAAGYSPRRANVQGSILVRRPPVRAEIERRRAAIVAQVNRRLAADQMRAVRRPAAASGADPAVPNGSGV